MHLLAAQQVASHAGDSQAEEPQQMAEAEAYTQRMPDFA